MGAKSEKSKEVIFECLKIKLLIENRYIKININIKNISIVPVILFGTEWKRKLDTPILNIKTENIIENFSSLNFLKIKNEIIINAKLVKLFKGSDNIPSVVLSQ